MLASEFSMQGLTAMEWYCGAQQSPAASLGFSSVQRPDLFLRVVEPTPKRELKDNGTTNGEDSYSTELLGYVEIVHRGV